MFTESLNSVKIIRRNSIVLVDEELKAQGNKVDQSAKIILEFFRFKTLTKFVQLFLLPVFVNM